MNYEVESIDGLNIRYTRGWAVEELGDLQQAMDAVNLKLYLLNFGRMNLDSRQDVIPLQECSDGVFRPAQKGGLVSAIG